MISNIYTQEILLEDGRKITLETGKLAKQAHGSVVVRMGDCMLLATIVSDKRSDPSMDFLPLTVDYREKFAAAGRYPGGFFKREARPSSEEILVMRLVDRVLRPLFPKDYHAETQVMIQLMSHDPNVMPDALAGLAASAAIALSDVPFETEISEVRVGRIDGIFVINPTLEQLERSDIDMIIGASEDSVIMVEGEMNEISEEEMVDVIVFAHEAIKAQCIAQRSLVEKVGRKEIRSYEPETHDEDLENNVVSKVYEKLYQVARSNKPKAERSLAIEDIKQELIASFDEATQTDKQLLIERYFSNTHKKAVRDLILGESIRLDGRNTEDIRSIWCEVGYLPSTHGSAIFTRGETQALATVTLGTSREANQIDNPSLEGEERFYLHYNFPPFSTGEARPIRGTSRREIGHGNLAQRALKRMIPQNCPYTVRVVSEVLESNGSSSMATVCAGTMAICDAGIQMKKPVSGIAMGLVSDAKTGKYKVLSDILGDEDHLGDMDFKVTGTLDGITACQMDIKIKGLSYEILTKALLQAKSGRIQILSKITDVIEKPSEQVKPHAPKIIKIEIDEEFIGAVIGPGGKVIQEIQKETETTIVIEESDGKGIIEILGVKQDKINVAIARIKAITFKPEKGKQYLVKVVKILDFGVVVEFTKGKEILLHISEYAWERTEDLSKEVRVGDEFEVKYFGFDPKTKKEKVSRKALLPRPTRKYDH